jgi:CxxC motif-containing protein (DUF1111 family)
VRAVGRPRSGLRSQLASREGVLLAWYRALIGSLLALSLTAPPRGTYTRGVRAICQALLAAVALSATAAHARGGGPLPNLTPVELREFAEGFTAQRTHLFAQQGLGPAFNAARCYQCHSNPALGGQSKVTVVRFGSSAGGTYDPLIALGGPVLQAKALSPACAEALPANADVVSVRNVTSTFGAGLIEAIPDQEILDRTAAEFAANPAMAGRPNLVTGVSDGVLHVGRFGWKAQRALIVDAVGEAMLNELGITNAVFPSESAPGGNAAVLAQCDTVADPEDTGDMLTKLSNLLRFLAPVPPPRNPSVLVQQGEALFRAVGCDFCHYSAYVAASANPVLDGKHVDLFSDLLLHDIGTGDGVVQGDAQGNEFRTAPLWLVRGADPYLHDGRAKLIGAIDAHHNQAQPTRDAFYALSQAGQSAVLKFLNSR